ncbi:SDR family oxidoreductase [Kitasatospora cineracea]|uniref:SDR family oxidoreductase n=1 Tax=Kitasatospora cineracea TaxID=88074 RepID=UPI00379251F5
MAGKVALVTGGGKGVGAAISRELAARGALVVVNHFHSPQAAEETVAAIRAAGGRAEALRGSVAKHEQVSAMFAVLAERHGGVDVLVNNAARGVFARYDDLTDTEWQRALDTNLHGARWCALAAAPLMAARGGGAIVNVSSIGAGLAMDDYLLVGVCKAALEALTRYLAADLGPSGIRVNTASAGLLDNPTASLFPAADALRATCAAAAPLGGVGQEADLARLVAFLASPQSRWISGQCLLADGGLSVGRAMLTPRQAPAPVPARQIPRRPGPANAPVRPANAPVRPASRTVAVVGTGLVAPGAGDPEEFWQRLVEGVPQFGEPGERFPLEHFWSAEDAADRTYSRVAGYLRPTPDPAEDFLTAWTRTALLQCDAPGLAARPGVRTACFAGAWVEGSQHVEESVLVEAAATGIAAHWPEPAIAPERAALRAQLVRRLRTIYRHAGLPEEHLPLAAVRAALAELLPEAGTSTGPVPVQVVDTACSSALYAIDLGTRAVLDGECELALCGGVFSLGPRYSVLFSRLRGLSRSGTVRAFDADADGVLFADGAAFVALKRLDAALADGDRVLGVLAGFGAASDGRGRAVHAPNPSGQQRALARARAVSGLPAERVDWVVAHATGTPVGDGVERGVLAEQLPQAWCTSNKSVVGHTGWAAGAVSVVHALQGLAHSTIPPQLPYRAPDGAPPLRVPTAPTPWPRPADRPRTVGVSAFGFGGTNGHLLLQDAPRPGESAPPSLPAPLPDDPVVVVARSSHLPGTPTSPLTERQNLSSQRSFGPTYPIPPFAEVRLPAPTAAGIDRAQLMALQATAALVRPDTPPWWDELRDSCGVFAAHTGIPAASPDLTVRCHAAALTAALAAPPAPDGLDPASLRKATEAFLDAVRGRTDPGEDTLAGLMPNVVPARIAALHDLHGPTMTLDTGPTSGRTALRAAAAHLRRGELELALVLGVNGVSDRPRAAEGAFALLLTRASVARTRQWPVLAPLDTVLAALERTEPAAPADRWDYLGANDLATAVRHLTTDATTTAATAAAAAPLTWRHTLSWSPSGTPHSRRLPLPADTLVITGATQQAALRAATPTLPPGTHLLAVDAGTTAETATATATDPGQAVDRVLAEHPSGFRHLRVVADLHAAPPWPAPPTAELLAVQEAAFWAVRQLRDGLDTLAVGVAAPFHADQAAPHAHLFTGFVKSLAWELPDCTVRALVSDRTDPVAVLSALEDELAVPADGLPVTRHHHGTRLAQRLTSSDPSLSLPGSGADALLPPHPVVVATGGARGITAACLLGLADQLPLRLHLVGSSRPAEVPGELLDAPDAELPAARARYIAAERARDPRRPVGGISAAFDRLLHARESALTLRALRAACGAEHVHFHTCDVTDPAAVRAVAEAVRVREGRVDLLVNGAGLHHPGDITRKTLPGMRRIRDVKLAGYHHLRAAFDGPLTPGLWCNFGSVTGLVGLPGESDYSPANDFLSAAAQSASDDREFTIAWTIWDETGLGSGPVVQSYTARTARLSRMSTAEGVAHFLSELRRRTHPEGRTDRLVTFVGTAEHHSFDTRFPGLRTPAPPLTTPSLLSPAPPLPAPPLPSPALPSSAPPLPTPAFLSPAPSLPTPAFLSSAPSLPTTALSAPIPGLLGAPVHRQPDHAVWELLLDLDTHAFLRHHLVDDRPTVPGVVLADLAVQAARTLARDSADTSLLPPLPLLGIDRLAFRSWVRARTDGRPARFRIEAHRRPTRWGCAVRVSVRSDVVAPDGRVLATDREHFRATVRLGGPPPLPVPHALPPALTATTTATTATATATATDPYYDPASPVLLTGPFRATRDWRATPTGTAAHWRPDPAALAALPRLSTPAVLLDSLARTPSLAPGPDGRHPVAVPHHIERITLHLPGDDHDLLHHHPEGLHLHHSPATGTSTATTPDGHRVVAQITGLHTTVLTHLPPSTAPSPPPTAS